MSIQRLPVFLSAAEHLNFTRAAEEHHISQTAVSQQIKLLEQELGFPLFVREKRGVMLTQAGETLYLQCKDLLTQYNSAVENARRVAMGLTNALTIGYCGVYDLWLITRLLRAYHDAYPTSHVELVCGGGQEILNRIASGQVDLAVTSSFGLDCNAWLEEHLLSSDRCVLMISAKSPLASQSVIEREQLRDLPVVLASTYHLHVAEEQIDGMYAYLGMGENKRIYANDFLSMALLVAADLGVTMAPEGMGQMNIEGVRFVPIRGFHRRARTRIVYPGHSRNPAVAHLLALLS